MVWRNLGRAGLLLLLLLFAELLGSNLLILVDLLLLLLLLEIGEHSIVLFLCRLARVLGISSGAAAEERAQERTDVTPGPGASRVAGKLRAALICELARAVFGTVQGRGVVAFSILVIGGGIGVYCRSRYDFVELGLLRSHRSSVGADAEEGRMENGGSGGCEGRGGKEGEEEAGSKRARRARVLLGECGNGRKERKKGKGSHSARVEKRK